MRACPDLAVHKRLAPQSSWAYYPEAFAQAAPDTVHSPNPAARPAESRGELQENSPATQPLPARGLEKLMSVYHHTLLLYTMF